MNNKHNLKDIWPLISESISSGGEFTIIPNGVSMLPLIRPGVDSVTLVLPDDLKNNDIVLYKRESGQFVLHRLIKLENGYCTMFGDNQNAVERGVPLENVLAKVKALYRDNEKVDFESKEYKKYVKRVHRRIRRYRLPNFLYRIKHKMFKTKSASQ